jgi:hypothetical protein
VPRPQEKREELGVAKRVDADVDEALAWTGREESGRVHAGRFAVGVPGTLRDARARNRGGFLARRMSP